MTPSSCSTLGEQTASHSSESAMIRSMLKILTARSKQIWPDTTTSLNLIVTDRLVRLHVSFTTKEASSSRTQISVQCTNRITGDDVQGCLGRFTSLMTVQLGKQAYERWDGAQLESTELLGYVSLLGGVADAVSVSPQEPHLVIAATVFGPEEADQEQAVSRISAAVLGQQDFTLRVVNH